MGLTAEQKEMLNKASWTNYQISLGDVIDTAIREGTANAVADSAETKKNATQIAMGEQNHSTNMQRIQVLINDLETLHKAYGRLTTVGGAAIEEFLLPTVLQTDDVITQLHTKGASPVTIVAAKCMTGKIVITFSADPGNDHVFSFNVSK